MKKLSVFLALLPLVGCDNTSVISTTADDFNTVQQEIFKENRPFIAGGANGDFLIRLAQTDEIAAIASKTKTAKFLSIENPAQYVLAGQCLLNIIPVESMPDNPCRMRLFCGDVMNMDELYAVELCEPASTEQAN